jgi:hypothetical protein
MPVCVRAAPHATAATLPGERDHVLDLLGEHHDKDRRDRIGGFELG